MKILISALFICFLFPMLLNAQESPKAPPPDVRVQIIDGKKFVCFTEADSLVLLQMRLDYPKLQLQLVKQDELIMIKDQEITALTVVQRNLNDQIKFYKEENAKLQKEVDSSMAWYRSPYLWFGVGAMVATGASIGIFYAAK